jgi:hypothetical protein
VPLHENMMRWQPSRPSRRSGARSSASFCRPLVFVVCNPQNGPPRSVVVLESVTPFASLGTIVPLASRVTGGSSLEHRERERDDDRRLQGFAVCGADRMSTENLCRLARQIFRDKDPRVEWRRTFFDGRDVVVAVVLSPNELNAEGCPRVLEAESGLSVGDVLERLQRKLSAQVARLPS